MYTLNMSQTTLRNTYFRPVSSFPKKWMTTVLKTKLENTVNNPAIPGDGGEMECWCIFMINLLASHLFFSLNEKQRNKPTQVVWG